MKATNSFHNTTTDIEILEEKDTDQEGKMIRVAFSMNDLCGMSDCSCWGCDQRPYIDDWYLARSFRG